MQQDPRMKVHVKEAITRFLYTPVYDRFNQRLSNIITRNTQLSEYRHKSFVYKNDTYFREPPPFPRKRNTLVPSLKPEMEAYLQDVKDMEEGEMAYVTGYIAYALNSSNHPYDYLLLFPSSVHPSFSQLLKEFVGYTTKLTDERVREIQEQNQTAIDLMKQRQMLNLIL